ncbi:MAG: sialate O-acetylesterase [Treponema sp.]|nr:sialate O-acetylesterase [Treponema sp.]
MRRVVVSILVLFGLLLFGCVSSEQKVNGPQEIVLPDVDIFGDYQLPGEFHVFIAFGQSNMQGPGAIRAQDREGVSERFRIMNVVSGGYAGVSREKHKLYKAQPPLIVPDRNLTNYLGLSIGLTPIDYFGRTLIENIPQDITISVIAVASGDMALAAFHKTKGGDYNRGIGTLSGRPSQTETQGMSRYTGAGYANMYDAIILNARLAQRAGGIIKGIIVHQGESGPGFSDYDWDELLEEIYNDMLSDLGLVPHSIPILLGQTWNGGSGNTGGALSSESRIQSVLPNAWIISSIGCTGRTGQGQPDNIHFGSEGLQLLGTRYGEKMLELVYR